jgi:C4-dicarboxylate-specific signal transduction histidine kinase
LEVIKDIVVASKISEVEKIEATAICQEVKKIAERRNKYVHGLYTFSESGQVNIITNMTSKTQGVMVEVKAEDILSLAEECGAIVDRMKRFAFRGTAPSGG